MKRCPTCQRTYEEDSQKFCANDGTPLVAEETPAFDPEATVMSIPRPLLEEQPPADARPTPPEQPPTQYFDPSPEPPSRPEQDVHQSYPPPPSPTPGASPAWPPAQPQQPQQQPYYPQQGMAGGQPQAPPWQGGQQPQGWTPAQQQQQGQNWGGGGGYYPQQQPPPGQYAPYGAAGAAAATATGGSSKLPTIAMILGLIAFISIVAVFVIVSARIYDLRDIIEPLFWGSGVTGGAGLLLGIVSLVIARKGKGKAIVAVVLSIITLILFFLVYANMR
jgi:hypothetical protein